MDHLRTLAQWLCLIIIVCRILVRMKQDIEGRPAKLAQGFPGVVASVIFGTLWLVTLKLAGLFDNLLKW